MTFTQDQHTSISVHALSEYPKECVGVCVDDYYIELTNVSDNPEQSFSVDPLEYEAAIANGDKVILIHSHPFNMNDNSEEAQTIRDLRIDRRSPSKSDMATAQAMGIEFGIVCTEGETVSDVLFFNGDPKEYTGRTFASGASDCWQLVVDYYKQELNVTLPNTPRDSNWWNDTPEDDLYAALDDLPFLTEVDIRDIEHNDILLMSIAVDDDLINHSGVYLNTEPHFSSLLHHLFGRLSTYDSYFRFQQYAIKVLRYTGDVNE